MDNLYRYFMTSGSKNIKVLVWLLEHKNEDNLVYCTLDGIAVDCNVTKVTVNRVFQSLYDNGFMAKERNGVYKLYKV